MKKIIVATAVIVTILLTSGSAMTYYYLENQNKSNIVYQTIFDPQDEFTNKTTLLKSGSYGYSFSNHVNNGTSRFAILTEDQFISWATRQYEPAWINVPNSSNGTTSAALGHLSVNTTNMHHLIFWDTDNSSKVTINIFTPNPEEPSDSFLSLGLVLIISGVTMVIIMLIVLTNRDKLTVFWKALDDQ